MVTIFSKIIKGDIPCYKIAEDENFFAFLDINPIAKGHTLVVPKIEVDNFFYLDDTILMSYMPFCKKVSIAIEKVVPCNRVGMSVIGLEVPHAHVHLIPLNNMGDASFSKKKLEFSKEEFQEISNAIAKQFQIDFL